MPLSNNQIQFLAKKIINARSNKNLIKALSSDYIFGMEDAYKIQSKIINKKLMKNNKIVGWKLGYTSLAMRKQMNILDPNFGPLLNTMYLKTGSKISSALIQPKVEPEIALKFNSKLNGSSSYNQIYNSISRAYACLEVVDSIFLDYKFKIEDNTADGSSAAQFVLGPVIDKKSLDKTEVIFYKNRKLIDKCNGSAASGHPINGIIWLLKSLEKIGKTLLPNDIVITGGLTSAIDVRENDHIYADFEKNKRVELYG